MALGVGPALDQRRDELDALARLVSRREEVHEIDRARVRGHAGRPKSDPVGDLAGVRPIAERHTRRTRAGR
jgi:hypothetical protein